MTAVFSVERPPSRRPQPGWLGQVVGCWDVEPCGGPIAPGLVDPYLVFQALCALAQAARQGVHRDKFRVYRDGQATDDPALLPDPADGGFETYWARLSSGLGGARF